MLKNTTAHIDLKNLDAAVEWELLSSRKQLRWARVYLICISLLSAAQDSI